MKKNFTLLLTTLTVLASNFFGGAAVLAQESGLARHKQLYAVPVPGAVAIDGKLDDWDLSGQIEVFVTSDTRAEKSAKFAVMFDAEALYLSGEVRDDSPMMNRHDPVAKGNKVWDADSMQFRMTFDPDRPYPETENTSLYTRGSTAKDVRDDIKHLTLWYYTDQQTPSLMIHQGMTYRLGNPDWAPFGVVPNDQFQAVYRKWDDGKGYTFEYRIPWKTFGIKRPMTGGDSVAGAMQFNWGKPDGLKISDPVAGSAPDLMREPGFAFQNTKCWGRVFFSKTGKVDPALVLAGVPKEKVKPLEFSYELPVAGEVTLQLVDEKKLVRRTLLAQQPRKAGPNTEKWDGLDDWGQPLEPGSYQLRGIVSDPIRGEYLFSLHNSGQPPYRTVDQSGGWGADHGEPASVSALADGLLLGWVSAEYSWGILRTDMEGRKLWGIKNDAVFLANDGERFFTFNSASRGVPAKVQGFDLLDGRPLNFDNGQPFLTSPKGGTLESDVVTGLACANGKIYVSYGARNLVAVYAARSGDLETVLEVPSAGVLAARPDGSLAAISGGALVALRDGKIEPLASEHLDHPTGIAVDAQGRIYVASQGVLQDVAVFESNGKFMRFIGKQGGRPAMGKYDPSGMYQPKGLTVDVKGRLWVAENSDYPKRISVWDTGNGSLVKEFFGASDYFAYATIDPKNPLEAYCHNVLWKIDWKNKSAEPMTTIWRRTDPGMVDEPGTPALPRGFQMFTAKNGKQYGWGYSRRDRKPILYRRDGDLFKPFAALVRVDREKGLGTNLGVQELDDPAKFPDGKYLWQDANDDQRFQANEFVDLSDSGAPVKADTKAETKAPGRDASKTARAAGKGGGKASSAAASGAPLRLQYVGEDLTIWMLGGKTLSPVKWLKNGQPVYDKEKMTDNVLTSAKTGSGSGYIWQDPDSSIYTLDLERSPSLARWTPQGEMLWGYPNIPPWKKSLGMAITGPGRIQGLTGPLGIAGDFTANMSYFGVVHIFRRDGTYVAAIFKDRRTGVVGPEEGQSEGQGASMVQIVTEPGGKPRTMILGGSADARITEIHGLETIRDLPKKNFVITAAETQKAVEALVANKAAIAEERPLVIGHGRSFFDAGKKTGRTLDETRGFDVAAAVDGKNLVFRYEIKSSSPLVNAVSDPNILFKGGNCLDIQIATDPKADPARKTPAPGDVRLLITMQQRPGESQPSPYAVLYRPKVKGFTGQPIVLSSPTGTEPFDEIRVIKDLELTLSKSVSGFVAEVAVPLTLLGLEEPKAGDTLRMDLGYLYGTTTGSSIAARSYLFNRSFSAGVIDDVPNESRLEPAQWGKAAVE